MPKHVAIVMDCGSTNATVTAIDPDGNIVAASSRRSTPSPQPDSPEGWIIWELDTVFSDLCECSRQVIAELDDTEVSGVTVTTCGADGAPVGADGTLTYPLICWQDERTEEIADTIGDRMPVWDIFVETGYQVIPFNSLFRLIWLRENEPQALEDAECFMMFAGLLSHRLCGEMSIDPTAAGTMMCMDMGDRDWSAQMLALADLDASFFPEWVEPGGVIGEVHEAAAEASGIPAGTPVVAAGHDTQFAAVGCGGRPGDVILSSGTWEILELRHDRFEPNRFAFNEGLLYECDAEPGLWNPQLLMMGSGVLEWLTGLIYSDLAGREDAYDVMIGEAEDVPPGSDGVTFIPSFVPTTGPTKKYGTEGTILGLALDSDRAKLYRAALEGMSFQMRHGLDVLCRATDFEAESIRVVGGGAKNRLWNQVRADVAGLPITITEQQEATAIGAAMFALVGGGVFSDVAEAQDSMDIGERTVEPSGAAEQYTSLYEKYLAAPPALDSYYDID